MATFHSGELKMRSRTVNVLVFLVGLGLTVLGLDLYVELIVEFCGNYRYAGLNAVDGYSLVFGSVYSLVGLWCLLGAIANLRNIQLLRQVPVRPGEAVVLWHLRILAAAVVCEVLAAVACWRLEVISSGVLRSAHWIVVATFALIPLTVIVVMVLRRRED